MSNTVKQIMDYINNQLKYVDAVYISNEKLAEELKVSKRTIVTSINYILNNNLLECYPIGHNSKAYCSPDSEVKTNIICKMIL